MSKRRGLTSELHLDFGSRTWYAGIADELAAIVRAMPVWPRFARLRRYDGTEVALTGFDKVVRDTKNLGFFLDADDDGVSFECNRAFHDVLSLHLKLYDDDLAEHAAYLETFLLTGLRAFPKPLAMPASNVMVRFTPDLRRAKVAKPKIKFVQQDAIVDVLDARIRIDDEEDETGPVVAKLLADPPPPEVRAVAVGKVVVRSWAANLHDDRAIASARDRHASWMSSRLQNM